MKLSDIIETLDWAEKNFGSLCTNRQLPRRDMMRAIKRGFAQSIGLVSMCDDDGSTIDPERYREGFKLTDAGRKELERLNEGFKQEEWNE